MKQSLTILTLTTALVASACAAPREPELVRLSARSAPSEFAIGKEAPVSLSGSYLAGRHAASINDSASAARLFSDALAKSPNDPVLRQRAILAHLAAGRIDAAADLAQRVGTSDPTDGTARLVLALRAFQAERFSQARSLVDGARENLLDAVLNPLLVAWAWVGEGRIPEALQTLTPSAGEPGFAPFLTFHSALIQDLAGHVDAADQAYRNAQAQLGSSIRLVQAYGRFLERNRQIEKARALYEGFLEETPDHPVIAAELHRLQGARTAEALISTPKQGAAEALYDLGSLLDRSIGAESLVYFRLALYLDPELDMANLLVADLLDKSGRSQQAIAEYDAVTPDSPLYETMQIQKALALDGQGRTEEAIAALDRLIARKPESEDAVIARADILRMRERFDQAIAGYDRAIAMIGKPTAQHWGLYYARGVSLERAKHWPAAERDLKFALELHPDEPLVLNYLGYSWVEKGQNLDRAQAMIEKAASQRPTDGYIVDSLGWVLYQLGHYQDAVVQLERAVELKPSDPLINTHLGDAYWRVGRKLEARFQWRHALSLKPEKEVVADLKRKIDSGLEPGPERQPGGTRAELRPVPTAP